MDQITILGLPQGSPLLAQIRRNLQALLSTPAGSCGGDRSYGISVEYVDRPVDVVENFLALEVIEKVAIYEPRVALRDVTTETDAQGHISNRFVFTAV